MRTDWKTVFIGDVASVKGGKRLPKGANLITTPNAHPYIRIRDLTEKRLEINSSYEYVDDETQKIISRYIVDTDDIIISIVGTIGLIAIIGESLKNANLTENCVKLVNINEDLDREYLYYYLKSNLGQAEIKKGIVGAVQPKLPIKNIQSMKLTLPSLDEQKKIRNILKSLDDKIELNNRINENLQQQARSIFDSFYEEALNQEQFTKIIDVLSGGTPKTGVPEYWDGDIPFFTPKDAGNPYIFETEKYISSLGISHCNSRLYPKDTTFITARGTVGKVSLAGIPMAMNQSCYALASHLIDPILVYFYTLKTIADLKHKASGAVFDAITTRDFEAEKISILSEEETQIVLDVIKPIMAIIHINTRENIQLANLRGTLLPQLLSGSLDVSEVEV